MPRGRRESTASQTWCDTQARCLWPGQVLYEAVRPVLMLGQPIKERAREVGLSAKTLSRTLDRFVQLGLPGLERQPAGREGDRRLLPAPLREHILRLKAEHPPLTANEIATICQIAFDRAVNHSTVRRVLARSPLPALVGRRFPRYREMADGEERRAALLRLHLEGWTTARGATAAAPGGLDDGARRYCGCTWRAGRRRASPSTWRSRARA